MTEILTSAQMRAIETAQIESGSVTGLELMERAGRGVVAAMFAQWPEFEQGPHRRALVLCGPGNNGGDGFVIARLLHERGWLVDVFLYGAPEKLPPDARHVYERWIDSGRAGLVARLSMPVPKQEEVKALDMATRTTSGATGPELIVDALFGTGLSRPITALGKSLEALQINEAAQACSQRPYVVAVDIPSGLCADSGRILGGRDGVAISADLTVAFHARKPGHVLAEGGERCGKVVVADIGLESGSNQSQRALADLHGIDFTKGGAQLARMISALAGADSLYPKLCKSAGHKYTHGHALILSGGPGRGGAARLAARAALRSGSGLVTVGCPPDAVPENAARLDAVMLCPLEDAQALAHTLEDTRINALCLGPGLGLGTREGALVAAALTAGRATVFDADALTLIAGDPALFAALHDRCVLTPHAGEFARLFPDLAERLHAPAVEGPAYSKLDAARDAAARSGCTVLIKGPDTVISTPDGRACINAAVGERAAPWLATAGSGDVLAGLVAGLLARGLPPFDAAQTAAYLHVEAAIAFGPGLIAEDLPEILPKVLQRLGA
ncbi:NAD(P)H-hydrate dehydratase [Roseinatronobacter bogoriensis]|uniref:Bifunctional NAD(P)H-hydrate repair enzyme n=1 Tax=Roseinatronobacter bogoriensis subsp. barguzinensis TaxID=441209 RepID=A0A2K8KBT4_9RHOB|nr:MULTISPECIES: NAD(P)H-hydrate dehydratase [Rhodobaca]ATX66909.1 bifunctional ADP-dependent NAD(P)H-hydrate dehydratase/NAD(P)H-hydrate epimerase [Rhodobaca barguzinensis]MBB4206388.1 hydroxyethylthiazole kinase-like uncharacterized protein yjeF [Rhodobaca bogoriensis DSM 18756]TDW41132.1 hydroxyethylthiazole kinase-like uncharacterized protein yjeF/hydroxyethylthiazole kinase-like uncharacterized protein yjeF [Rhodobaca barguzinensis]TDY74690.1 hydroxyethylthiazole kinase-like uncharacterize